MDPVSGSGKFKWETQRGVKCASCLRRVYEEVHFYTCIYVCMSVCFYGNDCLFWNSLFCFVGKVTRFCYLYVLKNETHVM